MERDCVYNKNSLFQVKILALSLAVERGPRDQIPAGTHRLESGREDMCLSAFIAVSAAGRSGKKERIDPERLRLHGPISTGRALCLA